MSTCKCNRTKRSAKYRIFVSFTLFSKPCSPPFYTTIASNSYIPPTFSLENVFLYLYKYRQYPAKSNSFSSFQTFSFSVSSVKWSLHILSIIKLLGTECIISHTFQCERYFSLRIMRLGGGPHHRVVGVGPEILIKYHKGDFADTVPYMVSRCIIRIDQWSMNAAIKLGGSLLLKCGNAL